MKDISKEDKDFVTSLLSLTPAQFVHYIELVSVLDEIEFTNGLKRWFVRKFISEFNVPVRIFRSTQKRYKTELRTDFGSIIGISKMDSKDMDAAYIKLYDNYTALFLEVYKKHSIKPFEFVGVAAI